MRGGGWLQLPPQKTSASMVKTKLRPRPRCKTKTGHGRGAAACCRGSSGGRGGCRFLTRRPWSADRRRRRGSASPPFPRRHRRQGGHAAVQRHERYARCPRGGAPTTPAAAAADAATARFAGAERLGDGGEEVPRPLEAAADTSAPGGDGYHVELVQAVHVVGSVRVECHVPADAVPSAAGRHTGAPAADSGRPPVGRRDGRRSHRAIATWA